MKAAQLDKTFCDKEEGMEPIDVLHVQNVSVQERSQRK